MLTGSGRTAVKCALVRQAALALRNSFVPSCGRVCKQVLYILPFYYPPTNYDSRSDTSSLGGSATVVRDRCYILDKADVQTCRLKRADCGLTSRSGSLNVNLNGLHTVIDSLLCSCLGCALCSEGSALTRALEAHLAGRCPRYGITVSIGDRNDRVVECSTDMRCSALDILFLAAFLDYLFSYLCHLYSFTPLLLLIRNSLRRTLACSCVCLSALTSDGQTLFDDGYHGSS